MRVQWLARMIIIVGCLSGVNLCPIKVSRLILCARHITLTAQYGLIAGTDSSAIYKCRIACFATRTKL